MIYVLTSFFSPPLIQEAACWALNNLLMYQNSLHEKIGDEDGQSVVLILYVLVTFLINAYKIP